MFFFLSFFYYTAVIGNKRYYVRPIAGLTAYCIGIIPHVLRIMILLDNVMYRPIHFILSYFIAIAVHIELII